MSISKYICNQLNGDLKVISKVQIGTKVIFTVEVQQATNRNRFRQLDKIKKYYSVIGQNSGSMSPDEQDDNEASLCDISINSSDDENLANRRHSLFEH